MIPTPLNHVNNPSIIFQSQISTKHGEIKSIQVCQLFWEIIKMSLDIALFITTIPFHIHSEGYKATLDYIMSHPIRNKHKNVQQQNKFIPRKRNSPTISTPHHPPKLNIYHVLMWSKPPSNQICDQFDSWTHWKIHLLHLLLWWIMYDLLHLLLWWIMYAITCWSINLKKMNVCTSFQNEAFMLYYVWNWML